MRMDCIKSFNMKTYSGCVDYIISDGLPHGPFDIYRTEQSAAGLILIETNMLHV